MIKVEDIFTTANNSKIKKFTLTNKNNISIDLINYGAAVISFKVPDKNGNIIDIVLSHKTFEQFESSKTYFGTIVGRYANRIKNGKFNINGTVYKLNRNFGNNHTHGGNIGFDKKLWDYEINGDKVVFSLLSEDMDEHYPGNLKVKVSYQLTDENALEICYEAISDKDTIVNLTNHSYFNLNGHNNGHILDHELKINATTIAKSDEDFVPNGEIENIENTIFDFSEFKRIGTNINDALLKNRNGYDHCYNLNINNITEAAIVKSKISGIILTVETTKPALQFYTGNDLHSIEGQKDDCYYKRYSGLCLETQYPPNGINTGKAPVLKASEKYIQRTIYRITMSEDMS